MPESSTSEKYEKMLEYMFNLHGSKSVLGLERIQEAMEKLGNPQNDYKTIHIAGTNGKGSVAAMISSALKESELKTGLYISPHLVDFRERISVNGKRITKTDVVKYAEKIKNLNIELTYFEFVTAMAYLYFKEKKVDYAVIEVGLGGRLDATNVITPAISVITSISNDHESVLGKGVEDIAREKSFIVKKGVPVVTGTEGSAYLAVWERAKKLGAPIIKVEEKAIRLELGDNAQRIEIDGKPMNLSLFGDYQLENASIAYYALKELGKKEKKIKKSSIAKGFGNVKWPARFQIANWRRRTLILDAAHNPAGMRALRQSLRRYDIPKLITVAGIKKTKNYSEMLTEIEKMSDFMIFSKSEVEPVEPTELVAGVHGHAIALGEPKKAMGFAHYMAGNCGAILVTGSIYFVGKVMKELKIKV